LSKGAAKLREQANIRWPKRDTSSDGWLGDPAHRKRVSDHNPDRKGIVHAIDLDADFGRPGRADAQQLVDELVALAKAGKDGGRLKYIIHASYIYSRTYGWKRRKYTGSNPHTGHIHISVTTAADTNGRAWPVPMLTLPKPARKAA
jgi:hypothetical protein